MPGAVLIGIFAFCLAVSLSLAARRPLAAALVLARRRRLAGHARRRRHGAGRAGARGRPAPARRGRHAPPAGRAAAPSSPAPSSSSPRSRARARRRSPRTSSSTGSAGTRTTSPTSRCRWPSSGTRTTTASTSPRRRRTCSRSTGRGARSTGARRRSTPSTASAGRRSCARSAPAAARVDALGDDPSAPTRARPAPLAAAEVTIRALRDNRLPAPSTPVRYEAPRLPSCASTRAASPRRRASCAAARSYTVWSYAPRPTPALLARVRGAAGRRAPRPLPRARARRRSHRAGASRVAPGEVRALLEAFGPTGSLAPHRPLFEVAQRIAGGAPDPYAAVVALEAWLRSRGRVPLRRAAAAPRRPAGARRLRHARQGGLLPALRGRDGAHAALARHPGPRRRRLHERRLRRRRGAALDGDRPRRARVGRGLVRRLGLAAVRPDARARPARRLVLDARRSRPTSRRSRTRVNGDGNPNLGPAFDIDGGPPVDGERDGPFGRSEGVGLVTLLLLGGAAAVALIGGAKLAAPPAPLRERGSPSRGRRVPHRAGRLPRRPGRRRAGERDAGRARRPSSGASSASTPTASPPRSRRRASRREREAASRLAARPQELAALRAAPARAPHAGRARARARLAPLARPRRG